MYTDILQHFSTFLLILLPQFIIVCSRSKNVAAKKAEEEKTPRPESTKASVVVQSFSSPSGEEPVKREKAKPVKRLTHTSSTESSEMASIRGSTPSMIEKRIASGFYEKEADLRGCNGGGKMVEEMHPVEKRKIRSEEGGILENIQRELDAFESWEKKKRMEKMEEHFNAIGALLDTYLKEIGEIQKLMKSWMLEEFGKTCVLGIGWVEKLASITSRLANRVAGSGLAGYPKALQMCHEVWRIYEPLIHQFGDGGEKYHGVIVRLVFLFHFLGDIPKATLCLSSYISFNPLCILVEMTLSWFLYLGEHGVVARFLKTTIMRENAQSTNMSEFLKLFLEYSNAQSNNKGEILDEILKIKTNTKTKEVNVILQNSYLNWMRSFLANVELTTDLQRKTLPDQIEQLATSSYWFADTVKNQMPALWPEMAEIGEVNFQKFYELTTKIDVCLTLIFCSSLTWMLESRRSWAMVKMSAAHPDAGAILAHNWLVSLRMASPYRVLQSMNDLLAVYTNSCTPNSHHYSTILRLSVLNFVSPDPLDVRCNLPKRCEETEAGKRRSDRSARYFAEKIAREMSGKMSGALSKRMEFHRWVENCSCVGCLHQHHSSFFAIEYMLAYVTCANFTEKVMVEFDGMFEDFRLMFQRSRVGGDENEKACFVQLCEIYGRCAVRWLHHTIHTNGGKGGKEAERLIGNALRWMRDAPLHTFHQRLVFEQLVRQFRMPMSRNQSWMRVVRVGSKEEVSKGSEEVDVMMSPILNQELRSQITRYNHVLNRDWRFQTFTYFARHCPEPWEAAWAWVESTSARRTTTTTTLTNATDLRTRISTLPDTITIVQLASAENGDVYALKMHADRRPLIIPLLHQTQARAMVSDWRATLDTIETVVQRVHADEHRVVEMFGKRDAAELVKDFDALSDSHDALFSDLDRKIALIIEKMQKVYLDVFAPLLLPASKLTGIALNLANTIHDLADNTFKSDEPKELVQQAAHLDRESWKRLVWRIGELCGVSAKKCERIAALHKECVDAMKANATTNSHVTPYTFLVIHPELAQFCWEHLPIFDRHPYVTRMVSVGEVLHQTKWRGVDLDKQYFLVDPGGELGAQYRQIKRGAFDKMDGVCRRVVGVKELAHALHTKDALFYLGTGDATRFMGDALRVVSTSGGCRAICLLFATDGLRLADFDGVGGILNECLQAGSPTIVGCVWPVISVKAMSEYVNDACKTLGASRQTSREEDGRRELVRALRIARNRSRFPYLIGCSVVVYGMPARWGEEAR